MKIGLVVTLFSFILVFASCDSSDGEKEGYSFFVAGHAYGKAVWGDMVAEPGIHPPFVEKFDYINKRKDVELGFFTGDVVQKANKTFWDKFDHQVKAFDFPTYIAPGNHDINGPQPFVNETGFGYTAIHHNHDLYIVLNTSENPWQIDETQRSYIKVALESYPEARNIFVFAHHLIFWDQKGRFGAFEPNWFEDKPSTTNFESEVLPLFEGKGNHIYFFFGDVGARDGMQLFYTNEGHHSYIASGMGGFERDNFLIVNVGDDHAVDIEVVFLNELSDDVSRELEDYQWPR